MRFYRGSWNEDHWSAEECKAVRGIAAIGIILHHLAQKTAASWVPSEYLMHGLDPFVNLGYILVGIFFFCSGYGLYMSMSSKPDYLKGFIGRHFRPVIFCYLIANSVFYLVGEELSGYNWYIYAILYLYLAFFLCFRYTQKERTAVILLLCSIVLYIAFCDFSTVGTWSYNTVGVFAVGLLFAKYREKLIEFFGRRYVLWLAVSLVLSAVCFAAALSTSAVMAETEVRTIYNLTRLTTVLLQFLASAAFSIFIFLLNRKISFSCKVLQFLGTMSLELYLIHVTFVELFSYWFVNEQHINVLYIRNPFLYALVVLVLSVISAYALHWAVTGWRYLLNRFDDIFAAIRRDTNKVVIGILIAACVITVFTAIKEAVREPKLQEKVAEYAGEHNRMLDIDGQTISVYDAGEGSQTILVVAGYDGMCPTIVQKFMADELAKSYRVVVIDRPGTGFSDPHTTERTAENICAEIHSVAAALDLDSYILLTEEKSSIYAPYYVNKYVSEVQAVVNIDAETVEIARAGLGHLRQTMFEYERSLKRQVAIKYIGSRLIDKLGYRSFVWPVYNDMFVNCIAWQDEDVIYERFFNDLNCAAYTEEQYMTISNYLEMEEYSYPDTVPVLDFVSENRRLGYKSAGIDICGMVEELAAGSARHRIVNSVDGLQLILTSPVTVRENIETFLQVGAVDMQDGFISPDDSDGMQKDETGGQQSRVTLQPSTAELIGVHAGYAFIPIDGQTYRYEIFASENEETYTKGEQLLDYHEQDELLGTDRLWRFYALEEYPDLDVITGDELCRTLFKYSPAIGAGETAVRETVADGLVVIDDNTMISDRTIWQDFYDTTQRGEPASVMIATVYRNDHYNMSDELREASDEDYPSIFIINLSYDGQCFMQEPVHKINGEYVVYEQPGYDDPADSYKYLMHYEGPAEYSFAIYSAYDMYVLTDDDTVTKQDIEFGYILSTGEYIRYNTVICEYEYK